MLVLADGEAAERTFTLAHASDRHSPGEVALKRCEGEDREGDTDQRKHKRPELEGVHVVGDVVPGHEEGEEGCKAHGREPHREVARAALAQAAEEEIGGGEDCDDESEPGEKGDELGVLEVLGLARGGCLRCGPRRLDLGLGRPRRLRGFELIFGRVVGPLEIPRRLAGVQRGSIALAPKLELLACGRLLPFRLENSRLGVGEALLGGLLGGTERDLRGLSGDIVDLLVGPDPADQEEVS